MPTLSSRLRAVSLLSLALTAFACNEASTAQKPDAASAAAAGTASAIPSAARPAPASAPGASLETPAGTVTVVEGEMYRQSLQLKGKPIYPPTCPAGGPHCANVQKVSESMERIKVVRSFSPKDSKDLVVLFQSGTMGNACSGGPLFFATFKADASYVFSDPIDHCGGPDPVITQAGNVVTLAVAASTPTHGTGKIPATASEYDLVSGLVKKIK